MGNTCHTNNHSHGHILLGTNQDITPDPNPTTSVNKKISSETGNVFEVAGNGQFSGDVV